MHSAHYDSDGNIILDGGITSAKGEPDIVEIAIADVPKAQSRSARQQGWTTVHEPAVAKTKLPEQSQRVINERPSPVQRIRAESASQLHATAREAIVELETLRSSMSSLPKRLRGAVRIFWRSANTPLHLPAFLKAGKKPPTKLKLFLIDTVRFGGTFAAIFGVLFVTINYQSFFQIAKAELALSGDVHTQQALENMVTGRQETDSSTDTEQIGGADLLSHLPQVGPFENRLIIPKLGENIPIVRPSMDALMQEDWKQFENDIQYALKGGVVHYPGSARPGQAGNFFLTGHSSYYPWDDGKYKDVFARLKDLSEGDTYSVYYGGDRHTYRVTGKKEVKPSDVSVLDQPTDKRIATLMTCTPVGTTLRRLIITAQEIDPATGEELKVGEKVAEDKSLPTARLESLPI